MNHDIPKKRSTNGHKLVGKVEHSILDDNGPRLMIIKI